MTQTAFSLITPIIVYFFVGYMIDTHMKNKIPVATMLFTVLGAITGMWSAYKNFPK